MTMSRFESARLVVLAVAGLTAIALSEMLGDGISWQLWFMVPLVALLGLPHGCLDLAIAQRLRPLPDIRSILTFVLVYLALASVVLGIWWLAPGIALALFLGYSALHFSATGVRCCPGFVPCRPGW
jgi:hypothetical protein